MASYLYHPEENPVVQEHHLVKDDVNEMAATLVHQPAPRSLLRHCRRHRFRPLGLESLCRCQMYIGVSHSSVRDR